MTLIKQTGKKNQWKTPEVNLDFFLSWKSMQPWQAEHSWNLKQNLNPILFSNLDQFYEHCSKLNLWFQFKMKPGIMKSTSLSGGFSAEVSHGFSQS